MLEEAASGRLGRKLISDWVYSSMTIQMPNGKLAGIFSQESS